MSVAGPVRNSSSPGPLHAMVCAPPGVTTVSGDFANPNAIAAVAEAELPVPEDEVGPTPRSKMRISISRSLTTRTNSTLVCCGNLRCVQISAPRACQGLPADGEGRVVYRDDEVRIADDDFDARDFSAIGELDGARFEAGHVHAGGDVNGENAAGVNAVDAANARAGVGEDFEIVAGLGAERFRHPRGHATRAVAADFRNRSVGVVQADAAGVGAGPAEEFNAVRADAGVALANAARELGAVEIANVVFRNDQEIVAAGVSFSEGNQTSSKLQ